MSSWLNNIAAYQAYNNPVNFTSGIGTNPFAGSAGSPSIFGSPVQPAVQAPTFKGGIDEVAQIGAEKAAGFRNGLGGTNDPSGHKLFLCA